MYYAKIELFTIQELKAQENKDAFKLAISEHKQFLRDTFNPNDFDGSEDYTLTEYTKGLTVQYLVDEIEANEYLYYKNGIQAHCVQFTGKHPRAGEHILKLEGLEYSIIDSNVRSTLPTVVETHQLFINLKALGAIDTTKQFIESFTLMIKPFFSSESSAVQYAEFVVNQFKTLKELQNEFLSQKIYNHLRWS